MEEDFRRGNILNSSYCIICRILTDNFPTLSILSLCHSYLSYFSFPQWSILMGPLSFLTFINELSNCLAPACRFLCTDERNPTNYTIFDNSENIALADIYLRFKATILNWGIAKTISFVFYDLTFKTRRHTIGVNL